MLLLSYLQNMKQVIFPNISEDSCMIELGTWDISNSNWAIFHSSEWNDSSSINLKSILNPFLPKRQLPPMHIFCQATLLNTWAIIVTNYVAHNQVNELSCYCAAKMWILYVRLWVYTCLPYFIYKFIYFSAHKNGLRPSLNFWFI